MSVECTEPMSTVSVHNVTVEILNYTKSDKCGEQCEMILDTKMLTSQSKQNTTVCSILLLTKV